MNCHKINQTSNIFEMNQKILLLVFSVLLVQIYGLSLTRHDSYSSTCFYLPLGELDTDPTFTYTITKAWTADEGSQIKSGALNVSDFIHVQGWSQYSRPNRFFEQVGRQGPHLLHKLNFVKRVIQGSDAPQYGLSTPDLEFAFGHPSRAVQFTVPAGKALIALRFQVSVSGAPYIGRWSVLVDLVDDDGDLGQIFNGHGVRMLRYIDRYNPTPLDVARSLNIIPPFVESSIFWAQTTSPAQGTVQPVHYQAFLVLIRAGQEILAGPINDGQEGIIQVKDVVKERSSCA